MIYTHFWDNRRAEKADVTQLFSEDLPLCLPVILIIGGYSCRPRVVGCGRLSLWGCAHGRVAIVVLLAGEGAAQMRQQGMGSRSEHATCCDWLPRMLQKESVVAVGTSVIHLAVWLLPLCCRFPFPSPLRALPFTVMNKHGGSN